MDGGRNNVIRVPWLFQEGGKSPGEEEEGVGRACHRETRSISGEKHLLNTVRS